MTLDYEWWPVVLVCGMATGAALVVLGLAIGSVIETNRIAKNSK